ncbi:MAG: hypothetical protein KIT82_23135, partial [Bradyrhizobium sp.]|nr:hypothetical protein [Bradyrhizobium sp.]
MQFYAPGTRKGNRTYVVRWWDNNGSQREKVLEATTLAGAKTEAKRRIRRIEGHSPGETVGFADAADAYLAAKRLGKEDLAYIDRLKRFFRDKPVREIVGADLMTAAHAIAVNTSDSNKNRAVITPASSILHYAAEQGWCQERRFRR